MRIDFRLIGWGVFLVLAGVIPLAANQGWIPADIRWWELWPLILVGAGVGLLLRRTSVAPLGGIIVAATFGLMLGGVLASGITFPVGNVGCIGNQTGEPFPTQNGGFESSRVDLRLDMPCGDIEIGTAPGSGWSLSGTSDEERVPGIQASADRLTVRSPDGDDDFLGTRSTWTSGRTPAAPASTWRTPPWTACASASTPATRRSTCRLPAPSAWTSRSTPGLPGSCCRPAR